MNDDTELTPAQVEAAELRELIRQSHEARKDLDTAVRDARKTINRELSEAIGERIDAAVADAISKMDARLDATSSERVDEMGRMVMKEFDRLIAILFNLNKDDGTINLNELVKLATPTLLRLLREAEKSGEVQFHDMTAAEKVREILDATNTDAREIVEQRTVVKPFRAKLPPTPKKR